jgi:hypothetical protein
MDKRIEEAQSLIHSYMKSKLEGHTTVAKPNEKGYGGTIGHIGPFTLGHGLPITDEQQLMLAILSAITWVETATRTKEQAQYFAQNKGHILNLFDENWYDYGKDDKNGN